MFVKRRRIVNFNNNEVLENKNYPFNKNVLTKFCLKHKFECDGNSEEVNLVQKSNWHSFSIQLKSSIANLTITLNGTDKSNPWV